jgi:calcineurin-like phosphoesterase family protein
MKKINIDVRPGQKVFFTSDTHFGHNNILKFCQRPWADIKAHNAGIVELWNSVVGPDDIVFHMGDVCWFNSRHETYKLLKQLNGHIYIVLGNHDTEDQFELCAQRMPNFTVLGDTTVLFLRGVEGYPQTLEIVLNHYPLMTWSHRDRTALQFFGHIHSGPRSTCKFDCDLPLYSYQYDVGCDNNDYTPIEIRDLLLKLGWPCQDPMVRRGF